MVIANCIMCYHDIIGLIRGGFTPVRDLQCALKHNLLKARKKISMYVDFDSKFVDIMGYYVDDPFPRILRNPLIVKEVENMGSMSEIKETIDNDAYLHSCRCPECNKKFFRGYEERTFYCENCGTQLHQRAFTDKEIDDAIFQHEMDEYED